MDLGKRGTPCVTPQFWPSWTRPNCGIILENYSLEYSLGHTANADLNPLGGLRRRTNKTYIRMQEDSCYTEDALTLGSYHV